MYRFLWCRTQLTGAFTRLQFFTSEILIRYRPAHGSRCGAGKFHVALASFISTCLAGLRYKIWFADMYVITIQQIKNIIKTDLSISEIANTSPGSHHNLADLQDVDDWVSSQTLSLYIMHDLSIAVSC